MIERVLIVEFAYATCSSWQDHGEKSFYEPFIRYQVALFRFFLNRLHPVVQRSLHPGFLRQMPTRLRG